MAVGEDARLHAVAGTDLPHGLREVLLHTGLGDVHGFRDLGVAQPPGQMGQGGPLLGGQPGDGDRRRGRATGPVPVDGGGRVDGDAPATHEGDGMNEHRRRRAGGEQTAHGRAAPVQRRGGHPGGVQQNEPQPLGEFGDPRLQEGGGGLRAHTADVQHHHIGAQGLGHAGEGAARGGVPDHGQPGGRPQDGDESGPGYVLLVDDDHFHSRSPVTVLS
ncbi:hypothetical protein GCM10010507_11210 [Streptomyces cinnamoneus]|uniref:Uncharacterized protein n=1 Tax=Streptomyces cinnamoneus TaxID=53446 RepID=A0A918WEK6_STRCJ|nr:hypothetical protein GCM10010507_11210 [Streptomyces cinnamoneus]